MSDSSRLPSAALLSKARQLGIAHDPHIDAHVLYRLVEEAMLTSSPYKAQLREAQELGVTETDEHTTAAELQLMIKEAKHELSREVLHRTPHLREGAIIWHENALVFVIGISHASYMVRLQRAVPRPRIRTRYSRMAYELGGVRAATKKELEAALAELRNR